MSINRRNFGPTGPVYPYISRLIVSYPNISIMDLVSLNDYEKRASKILPSDYWGYFSSGACESTTVDLNRQCYKKLRLVPKCLQDVSDMDLSTNILGFNVTMPIGISPTASQNWAHPEGELANARAAASAGVIFTLSGSFSSYSMEQVAEAAPNGIKWFQLYMYQDRSVTEKLIRRAESAGFKAIVVTVDSPVSRLSYSTAKMYQNNRATTERLGNFEGPLATCYSMHIYDRSLSWEKGIKWLVEFTNLPVIAKGVLRAEDALKAMSVGCKGILVSNHGGRSVDTAPATVS